MLPYGKIEFEDKERFLSSIRTYEKLLDRNDPLSILCKNHLFEDILLQLCLERGNIGEADLDGSAVSCTDPTVIAAVAYIRDSLQRKLNINEICQAVCSNPSTLNFKFRRELSCSVGQFIIGGRMKKARRLLAGTTYSVAKIDELCGYENVFYFSHAFRKFEGEPPIEFRGRFMWEY